MFPVMLGGVPNELSSLGGRWLRCSDTTGGYAQRSRVCAPFVKDDLCMTRVIFLFCLFYLFIDKGHFTHMTKGHENKPFRISCDHIWQSEDHDQEKFTSLLKALVT